MTKFLWVCVLVIASSAAFGAKNTMMRRGGVGFLFLDHNNLGANPGHLAQDVGTGIEIGYTRQKVGTTDSTAQTLTTSVAYGNGNLGIGVFGNRASTDLTKGDLSADTVGAALGGSFAKQQLTVGASYQRTISSGTTNNGAFLGSLVYSGAGGTGIAIGAQADLTLAKAGSNTVGATGAIGYAFKDRLSSVEATFNFPDVNRTSEYIGSGYLNVGYKIMYFGGGYNYIKTSATGVSQAQGRVGVLLGSYVDLSAVAQYQFVSGSTLAYGGTLRASF
ncbi:MAG: hypothetical protein HY537_05200 [Deltaproteobacteria bacterium]|nr:hypothetical protein [Deltaproteobacteria bacterium]